MKTDEYSDEFRSDVIKLLSQGKKENYYTKKQTIWDWQYNSFSNYKKGVLVFENDNFVGFNGLMPIKLKYKDEIIDVYWSVDTILDPICRGKGYGGKIVDIVKKISPIIVGFGISDIQAHIMKKHGYKVNHSVEEYFYVSNSLNLKDIIKKGIQYFKLLKNIFSKPAISADIKYRVVGRSDIPKRVDMLWEKIKDGYSKTIVRDYSYIKWKYGEHPLAKYQFIIVEKGEELIGVGIYRKSITESKFVDYIGYSDNIQVKYLMMKIFKKICSESRLLSCICTDNEFKRILEILGFRKYKERPRFFVYSNKRNDQAPEKDWFIMAGDSDNDSLDFENY